jgi:hypothetical protein
VSAVLDGAVEQIAEGSREAMKDMLAGIVEKVVLDPQSFDCVINYRLGLERGIKGASPRGFEPRSPP